MNKFLLYSIIIGFAIASGLIVYFLTRSNTCPGNGDCNKKGTCNAGTGKCSCTSGFTGDDCSQKKCPGGGNCNGNGTCNGSTGKCACIDSHTGDGCETKSSPCVYDSDCDSENKKCGTNKKCECKQGFGGENCELKNCPGECLNGGSCNSSTGECKCVGLFDGDTCEMKKCPGVNGNCYNQGRCEIDGKCTCYHGFDGDDCTIDKRLRYNTEYRIQSNYEDRYLHTCDRKDGLFGYNLVTSDTPNVYNKFKLIKKGDPMSTDYVITGDSFSIKDVYLSNYLAKIYTDLGSGVCGGRAWAIIMDTQYQTPENLQHFFIENFSNQKTVAIDELCIIKHSIDTDYVLEHCGSSPCNFANQANVAFYNGLTPDINKSWIFRSIS